MFVLMTLFASFLVLASLRSGHAFQIVLMLATGIATLVTMGEGAARWVNKIRREDFIYPNANRRKAYD